MGGGKLEHVVWEGRYQPLHLGHLGYIRRLLSHADHVWLVVVANEVSTRPRLGPATSPVPRFTAMVDEHHAKEDKNPLPWWLRVRLVDETIRDEFPGAGITVLGGRRLDLDWHFYDTLLPPERVFLTPLRDAFEDAKAEAWASLGQKVLRIDVSDLPKVSATAVRAAARNGGELSTMLPATCIRVLEETGYLDALAHGSS